MGRDRRMAGICRGALAETDGLLCPVDCSHPDHAVACWLDNTRRGFDHNARRYAGEGTMINHTKIHELISWQHPEPPDKRLARFGMPMHKAQRLYMSTKTARALCIGTRKENHRILSDKPINYNWCCYQGVRVCIDEDVEFGFIERRECVDQIRAMERRKATEERRS